ncbi:tetratricopeptide repeat-containing diguanylate cyclase [Kineococcus rubinsiae]|uniref:tetratricopeptide repeat-containing diguanylate cyclase n=1 Tax=Kineococcus rubinsiae TaxID=2609562 RepID=UPI001430E9D4|nr:tetratricopeptide repeat-containing diguanylate cyclase [Kineococcus rubinsiae]NIZ90757.1 GGDEF domain-containing protein [Kineococcus rubinsiae]
MSTVRAPGTTVRPPAERLDALVASSEHARTQGAYSEGRRLAERAADLAAALGDDARLAHALRLVCNQAVRLGDHEAAARAGRRAVAVSERTGDVAGHVDGLNLLALTYLELGLFDEALTAMETAMAAVVTLDDHELRSGTFNRAGTVRSSLGDFTAAAEMFDRAEVELRAAGVRATPETEFCLLTNTTDLVIQNAHGGGAVPVADLWAGVDRAARALALAEASGNPYRVAMSHLNAGALLVHLDDAAAEDRFAAAVRISREHGYRSLELGVLEARAVGAQRRQDHRAALAVLAEVVALAEETHESSIALRAHRMASVSWEEVGDFRRALESYRRYHELEAAARVQTAEVRARLLGVGEELHQLRHEAAELERHALQDALTGLGNRRHFDAAVPGLLAAAAPGEQLCVALLDLDHFKAVNDTFGHSTGDVVLQALGALLRESVRCGDVLVRLGGEEFAVVSVLPEPALAAQLAEVCRARVEAHDWDAVASGLRVTASIGVVTADAPLRGTVGDLVATADRLLYAAKAAGRNRVHALALGEQVPQPERRVPGHLGDGAGDDVQLP